MGSPTIEAPSIDPGVAVAVITEDAIRELASFHGEEAPVTSCYLDVDGRRLVRHQDYEHELDVMIRSAQTKANGSASVAEDFRRIGDYVRAGFDRSSTRGLAMFACSAHDLFEVVPLPVPVRNRMVINSAPAVGQLESVVQDYDRFGVLLADKQRVRVFVFQLGELVERTELLDELPRDYDVRGHGDQGYDREQHHVDELAVQHLRKAAQVAFELLQSSGYEHVTIGAPDPIAGALESMLHPYVRDRLCGRINVGVGASLDDIRTAALALEADVDRRREAETVNRLRDAIGAGTRGCGGLEPVLRALHDHRIERLLVSEGFSEPGWHCDGCSALATVGRSCPVCGGEMTQLDDVVEEAVELALSGRIRVDICVGNADLDVLGRIGALLRY
jgi:peptide chain release factor subunit 1